MAFQFYAPEVRERPGTPGGPLGAQLGSLRHIDQIMDEIDGCETCRRRGLLCDGKIPRCQNCQLGMADCVYHQKPTTKSAGAGNEFSWLPPVTAKDFPTGKKGAVAPASKARTAATADQAASAAPRAEPEAVPTTTIYNKAVPLDACYRHEHPFDAVFTEVPSFPTMPGTDLLRQQQQPGPAGPDGLGAPLHQYYSLDWGLGFPTSTGEFPSINSAIPFSDAAPLAAPSVDSVAGGVMMPLHTMEVAQSSEPYGSGHVGMQYYQSTVNPGGFLSGGEVPLGGFADMGTFNFGL